MFATVGASLTYRLYNGSNPSQLLLVSTEFTENLRKNSKHSVLSMAKGFRKS